ncbi:MAG: ABC transporter ATP-binding protein, partial [Bdellovibrionota bacterium]
LVLVLLAVEIIRTLASIGQSYGFTLLAQRVMQDLRLRLFSHLQRLPHAQFDRHPPGRLITRLTNDIAALAEMFSSGFVTIVGNILTVFGILIALIHLNPTLGCTVLLTLPPLVYAGVKFSRLLQTHYRQSRSRLSALNSFLAENVLGMRVVSLFVRQQLHLDRYRRLNQWHYEAQMGTVGVFALLQPTITLATGIATALMIIQGGNMVFRGELAVGELTSALFYVALLFQPIREIADRWNLFLSGMASAERIFELLDWPVELKEDEASAEAKPLSAIHGRIVFENVWFAYTGENWVLRDFSTEIKPGAKVGIVGHTGAGKSTFVHLLLRLYEPQRGRILIDGIDIKTMDLRSLRTAIGIIQQDVFMFSGTIRENILLWRPGATIPKDALSTGFDLEMNLEERGSNLSTGQRQMIAFDRALAAAPSIWILDEATSNVDSESERVLESLLRQHSPGKTAIVIAHRLATVQQSDLLLVLHQGTLAEVGTHSELLAKNGLYAK